ncbi:MAG: LPS assembly protein LptD [Candidatus Competibacteraceae bacterium]|uniref:LPS-assembly protein LptD n=1 Tax=Candidatus Contendobacter odensis Run_B_J11 TaxID=1400861 RepID=A0A7U7J6D3_9GAMM|nr:LPS assembly protein LptD [Candidatus Contendobacter odensis]MBK8535757.1 LPS assembly protein LptD [Candidatus Competibacteraceae bacterium]MBK8755184.1 LPS assembly protein LptD [Candidatus Competibacteraceae bacterium]CDH47648.1 putative LPS-assembly protein lptD [Candidatus Contendobacter odensis Run_B_J11]
MLHYRMFLAGAALVLLPLTGVQAQAIAPPTPWALCEPDELAQDIVPATPNAPPPDDLPIQAEANRLDSSPTESRLEGNAHLSRGDQRLRADLITLDRSDNRARAENGFVYGDPRQALRGKQAEVDLNHETGWFKEVDYYLPGRNAQGSAEEVRVNRNQKQSQLQDASYSTCPRGNEVWQLRAHEINLNEETGRGSAYDMVLSFKDTPVFYFPYLSFPITDERQSGLLFPRQGYSSETGVDLAVPYYWNIAPNRDMTITPRLMTNRGVLLGVEYRFLEPWHQGKLGFEYIPDDRRYEGARGSFNVTDRAAPLSNVYTDLRYEYVSDDNYIKDLSNNLDFLTPNYLERHLDARYYGNGWQALARVQGYQILNPALFKLTGDPYQRLPQLLFNGDWPPSAGSLRYQMHGEMVNFQQSDAVTGTRLDLWPTVGWTLEQPWGYLKPQAGFRYTGYQLNNTAPGANDAPTRAAPVLSLDSGLIFDRSLQADWLGVAAGTQTLEPRLFYLYVPYRDQNAIPIFDSSVMDRDIDWLFRKNRFTGADRLGDANQLTAALTTRLLDGPSGRERLRASIGQIQYFEDRRVNLYPVDLPQTSPNSGLITQGQANLSSHWSVQGGVQLEPDNSNLLRSALDLRYYSNPRQLINVSYLLDRDQPSLGQQGDQINSVDISFFWPLSSQWRTLARWNQALNIDRNLETLAGLEYEDCCWALRVVARQYRDSPADVTVQTAFYMELELKGLSRLGSSLENQLRSSILGYQPIRY